MLHSIKKQAILFPITCFLSIDSESATSTAASSACDETHLRPSGSDKSRSTPAVHRYPYHPTSPYKTQAPGVSEAVRASVGRAHCTQWAIHRRLLASGKESPFLDWMDWAGWGTAHILLAVREGHSTGHLQQDWFARHHRIGTRQVVLIRSQFAEVRNVHIWIKSLEDTEQDTYII